MKKYVLLFVLLFTLTACDFNTQEELKCEENQKEENGVCVDIEDPIDTEDPIDKEDPLVLPDPLLRSEECAHLENIDEWVAVWCDEFDYEGLPDSTKWNYDVGGHGWGNGELQYYTENDLDNASVSDGFLTITAIREQMGSNDYTSARLVTAGKGDWLYGGWPNSGEIDIMEHVGYDVNKVYSTIHTGAYNHMLGTQIGYEYTDTTLETAFHVYEIEWEPGVIKTYIDGIHYASFGYNPDFADGILTSDAWPFDQDFHLILNIAVGGSWGGVQGVDTDIWPQEMVIDYVRVYQKDYWTGDTENPSVVTDLTATNITSSTAFLKWDKATDDMKVKEYEVYVDDVLVDTVSHNAINLEGLMPGSNISAKVVSVDFAGRKSEATEYSFSTVSAPTISGIIEAEDYTKAVGIDTENTTDTGGGRNVGWTDNGDYLEYVLEVTEAGNYTVDFRVASGVNGGTFTFSDGATTLNLTTPATGDWQNWQTITSDQIYLSEGTHTFTIYFTSGGTNINYFEMKKVD